jgi:hypothetical protein
MIQDLAIDVIESASDKRRNMSAGPTAQGRLGMSPSLVELFESLHLLGIKAEAAEGLQVLGALGAMVEVNSDWRRDSDLHRGHQQARQEGLDPRASDLLIQATKVQTQSVDDIALHLTSTRVRVPKSTIPHLGSHTICLAAGPGDGLL